MTFSNYQDLKYTAGTPEPVFITDNPNEDLFQQINITNKDFWLNVPSFSKNIAVIAMLDNKQINIKENSFISSKINGNIKLNINLDEGKSPSNLIIGVFQSPFLRMENEGGELIEFYHSSFLNKVKVE